MHSSGKASQDNAQKKVPPVLFTKTSLIVIGVLLVAALVWLFFVVPRVSGASAVVSINRGDTTETRVLSLEDSGTVAFEAGGYEVQLEIQNGAIRFAHSQCPDHRCEDFGRLQNEGEWALCAPAGVMVRIEAV